MIEYLQNFIREHFERKYLRLGNELQSRMVEFVSQQMHYVHQANQNICSQLKDGFHQLYHSPELNSLNIDKISSLIVTHIKCSLFPTNHCFVRLFSYQQSVLNKSHLLRGHLVNIFKTFIIRYGYHSNNSTMKTIIRVFFHLVDQLRDMKLQLLRKSLNREKS
ncbi:hypothetical protein I4U23_003788 [Adineta vaga]|nr:hypothetical protein I4U23_003788 [Adineta vaga]